MIHSGFNSLYSVEKEIDFKKIELNSKIKFPDTYKLFANCYKLGKDSLRKEYVLDEDAEIKVPLIGYYFGEGKTYMSIEDFIDVSEAIILRKTDSDDYNDDHLGMIRIAFTNDEGGGGFYMGLKEDNFGKIYKVSWDFVQEEGGGGIEIAESIFDFARELKSSLNTFNNYDFDKIYKNWGEDFWRIRKIN